MFNLQLFFATVPLCNLFFSLFHWKHYIESKGGGFIAMKGFLQINFSWLNTFQASHSNWNSIELKEHREWIYSGFHFYGNKGKSHICHHSLMHNISITTSLGVRKLKKIHVKMWLNIRFRNLFSILVLLYKLSSYCHHFYGNGIF